MGANFINSVLEGLAAEFLRQAEKEGLRDHLDVTMSILSNYTPECLVRCRVEAPADALDEVAGPLGGRSLAELLVRAVDIARHDPYRAVTHNKGIFNGMDAVILATGNDYRAAEACGHAYASRGGNYSSLSAASLEGGHFSMELEVPLALGTIGGLTSAHPLAAVSLEILGHPGAEELMQLVAAAGLANNFSALRALVTTGIQKGHMKMHLGNILQQLGATQEEGDAVRAHFRDRTPSHAAVRSFMEQLRLSPRTP
jgi:hydroxymethylglutaryl-CoA reductase